MDKTLDRTAQITAEIIIRRGIKESDIPSDPKQFIKWNIMLLQQEQNKIEEAFRRMADDE